MFKSQQCLFEKYNVKNSYFWLLPTGVFDRFALPGIPRRSRLAKASLQLP
jgi:hypothetical protein